MTTPPILPDWIPWWAQLALLVLALLFAVALLLMPFAVFGLKGRLDLLEAQLDDIHAELRMLSMRLPDAEPQRVRRRRPAEADHEAQDQARPLRAPERAAERAPAPIAAGRNGPDRSEPRLRWPSEPGGR